MQIKPVYPFQRGLPLLLRKKIMENNKKKLFGQKVISFTIGAVFIVGLCVLSKVLKGTDNTVFLAGIDGIKWMAIVIVAGKAVQNGIGIVKNGSKE